MVAVKMERREEDKDDKKQQEALRTLLLPPICAHATQHMTIVQIIGHREAVQFVNMRCR
jgi:ribosomal protein L18